MIFIIIFIYTSIGENKMIICCLLFLVLITILLLEFLSCFLNYKDFNRYNHRETQMVPMKPNYCVNLASTDLHQQMI